MLGILALEAHRAGAVVVGEDLGTVEPWVRDYLRERGLLGTSILWFELDRDGDGGPLPAERWREYCLSSVTTHDLPPTAGYLAREHVRMRDELGLLTRSAADELAATGPSRPAWLAELRRVGLLRTRAREPTTEQVVTALYEYLGRTPSRLLALALADAVGDLRTQNQPGTIDEYPNWRVPLADPDGRSMLVEDVFADPRAGALADGAPGSGNGPGNTERASDRRFHSRGSIAICSQRTATLGGHVKKLVVLGAGAVAVAGAATVHPGDRRFGPGQCQHVRAQRHR